MPVMPAYFLLAHAAQQANNEFVLHYRRPSAVLAGIKGIDARLTAFDDRGVVGITGSPAEMANARNLLKMLDTPRKRVLVRVTVTSPVDHLTWEVDARLVSGQKWRTSDGETDSEVALEPRVDEDGTLSVNVVARCNGVELTSQMRLPKGQSRSVALGKRILQDVEVESGKPIPVFREAGVELPSVTIRYIG